MDRQTSILEPPLKPTVGLGLLQRSGVHRTTVRETFVSQDYGYQIKVPLKAFEPNGSMVPRGSSGVLNRAAIVPRGMSLSDGR